MLIPKLQEIILPGSKDQENYCETFIYEPANIDEDNLGTLYLVGQFDTSIQQSCSLLNLLASVIKREFYLNPKRKTVDAFEAALKKANSTLADFITNDQINWPGKIHLVCAVIRKETLHLTQIGQPIAWLLRHNELVNITQNLSSLQKRPYPLKAFGGLVSGSLMANDRFILGTPHLRQCLSKLTLKRILSLSQLSDIVKRIQEKAQTKRQPLPLAVLLIELHRSRAVPATLAQWDKPAILPSEPINLSEIIKETEIRKQATVIPAKPEISAQNHFGRPRVLTKHYLQRLKKIIRKA